MNEKYNETTWIIMPIETPLIIKHCSKCNVKKEFYCSEKFRLNGRHTKIDIWLIYKCTKCDTTWKLTIKKGIKPHDISQALFDKFTYNDKETAWKYAFDRHLLKQNECEIQYANMKYLVQGLDSDRDFSLPDSWLIHIKSPYFFELKLSAFLAKQLGISISKIKKLVDDGSIMTSLECDIMKYRIRTELDVMLTNYLQTKN